MSPSLTSVSAPWSVPVRAFKLINHSNQTRVSLSHVAMVFVSSTFPPCCGQTFNSRQFWMRVSKRQESDSKRQRLDMFHDVRLLSPNCFSKGPHHRGQPFITERDRKSWTPDRDRKMTHYSCVGLWAFLSFL